MTDHAEHGRHYIRERDNFLAPCAPENDLERDWCKRQFDRTFLAEKARLWDACDDFLAELRATRFGRSLIWTADRIASIKALRPKSNPPLIFHDFYGGSGRADVADGFYLVAPMWGNYRAQLSDGKNWVWEGGTFATAALAEDACNQHFTKQDKA
jgi:hypothetical protein